MARINIEDSLFRDDRYLELVARLGNKTLALGVITEAFILAQKHYLNVENERLIPAKEWQRFKYGNDLIEVDLIEVKSAGIYVKGSEKQFGWLLQRSNAGKSASISRSNIRLLESTTVNDRTSDEQPLTLTLPLTLTQKGVVEEKAATSTTKTSTQKFDERFNPERQKILDLMKNSRLGKGLKKHVSEVIDRFETAENFEAWVADAECRYEKVKTTLSRDGWLEIVVKSEIGVISQRQSGGTQ